MEGGEEGRRGGGEEGRRGGGEEEGRRREEEGEEEEKWGVGKVGEEKAERIDKEEQ